MLSQQDLIDIISKGENPYIEFKEEKIKSNDLAGEIVSFANMEGGTIIIGVSDDGIIKGVLTEDIEEKIMNICRNNCIPNIIPIYKEISINGLKVVALTIPKGINKPYYTVDNKYYIRVGTTKRIASREELMRLFQASGAVHFDISPVEGTTKKDISMDLIRDYFLKYNMFDLYEETEEAVDRILVNADILKEGINTKECTVGGLLIFGRRVEDKLPQSGISFAHFRGNDIAEELIDKKQIVGNLPDIVEQALVIIKNNIKTPSTIVGAVREEKEIYPILVLREALVNAVVHRNYSIIGSKIRVLMFSDRIEFHSPGKLPNTVTIDKMKIGVSYSRNPFLVKYMENLRYIDQLGRGIPMIIKNMKNLGAREPELKEIGEEFVLTIYRPD
ncbi:ATP-binding protein [Tissierella sp. MB52-C2]|uniref:ATP-binding protein n=1 Tax=Tissierella sp. MB52-C2 TaxID=3070999 RepID=UPI00280A83C5|nr:ATP-binding protein [Tissierella sp. MB52-C2]WMM24315.1 ATP-binding protein [Tissierella sp. MB52-C2]